MNRLRTTRHRADQLAILHALAICGAALVIGCSSSAPPTTSATFSRVDAGDLAIDDATADTTPLPKSENSGGDAPYADTMVEAAAAPAVAPDMDVAPEAGDEAYDASSPEASVVADDQVTSPQVCGLADCLPDAPCPDLTVDRSDLLASIVISDRTFEQSDCAIAEGCITTTGTRKLLRFDTGTVNSGTADLTIGDPTENACFTFSQCHQHYHFRGVGRYTLYQSDGTTVAATGHKQGFCLEDVEPSPDLSPPPADPAVQYDCTNQGLHVGWEDIYPNDIDCQWIDITDVDPGDYILSVEINSGHELPESNYDNNEARVPVTVQ
jgi:hypothetical protein